MIEVADSLVVKFGGGANSSAFVKFELDDLLNEGKTSFLPLDTIYLRLQHDTSVQPRRIAATDGMMRAHESGKREFEKDLLFAEITDSHELDYLASGAVEHKWYGREGEGFKRSGSKTVTISGGDTPCHAHITYSADFALWKLIAPDVTIAPGESYPIEIVAYMEPVE